MQPKAATQAKVLSAPPNLKDIFNLLNIRHYQSRALKAFAHKNFVRLGRLLQLPKTSIGKTSKKARPSIDQMKLLGCLISR